MASTRKVRASKNRKQHSSVSGDDAHSVMTDDSPFSLSANPSKQNINNAVTQKKKKKKNQSNRNKQVPLVPTTAASDLPAENDNIKLSNSTMKFLHQSAALVGDAMGKDKNALMAKTISQPLPAKKKKKAMAMAKKVKSEVEENDSIAASGSVSFKNDGTEEEEEEQQQNNNTCFPAAGGGLNVVRERKSPSKPNSRMQSRGMISTSGSIRSAKKSTRPRTVGPSTVATVRSEAESLGAKLLGPLNLDGERKKAPLPVSLEEGEWENELARNILSLYSNQVVEELKAKKEAEVEAGKRKTRKLRRVKELKAKGKSDQEIEEIIRSERFSRKTRKSGMMKTAGSSGSGMTSAAMDVLGQLTSQEGYELPDEMKQSSFEESGAGGESRTQSRKSKFSRSSTRGTRVSMDSKGSTTVGSPNNSPQKDKIAADKAVVAPVRPKPIWFGGTGAIQAEWGALEEFAKSKMLRRTSRR
ncbi:hypothetical protein TrLO_g6978 [Triparma laevis f. longispina]|uniref:Uncharacterized protein n=1 Tax=Triparma laevis f. longispina TaxID=1714387 RepID=A0A9W7AH15_9STRA|nr:hypothetical protein TrLO_g6978 [Triparma laevis f. longispina]